MRQRHECEGGYPLPPNGGPCQTCGARQNENCGRPKTTAELATRSAMATTMLNDALNAVQSIYGDDGLRAVVQNMKMAARARDNNAEIDKLEQEFGSLLEDWEARGRPA